MQAPSGRKWSGVGREAEVNIKPPAKAECSERKDFGSPSTGWRLAGGRPCSRAAKGPHPPRVLQHVGAARPRVGRCGSHACHVRGRLCSTGRRFFCTRNSQKRIKISTMVLRSVKVPAFWDTGGFSDPHLLAHCAHTGARAAGQATGQALGCVQRVEPLRGQGRGRPALLCGLACSRPPL